MSKQLRGAIEAGGTKFICAAAQDDAIIAETRIATEDPHATLGAVERFFAGVESTHGPVVRKNLATPVESASLRAVGTRCYHPAHGCKKAECCSR